MRLNKGQKNAISAVEFCLLKGRQPFRVDVMTLLRLVKKLTKQRKSK